VVYETLNMASLWAVPVLFVVENNRMAQSTPIERHLAGDLSARFSAFGIPVTVLDTADILTILTSAGQVIEKLRSSQTPQTLILNTHRLGPHSKGDDPRPAEEIAQLRQEFDPISIHEQRIDIDIRSTIQAEVETEVSKAFQNALQDPHPIP